MVVGIRVESENIQTGKKKHCNSSYFTMVAKDENGKSTQIPGIILNTEQELRRFARSIKRQEESKNRSSRFSSKVFKADAYLHLFEGSNAKITIT